MPLVYYHLDSEREVGLWKASESDYFFISSLEGQGFDINPAMAIRHPAKRRQWYASRYLLILMYPAAIAMYAEGKPYLFNGPFLSFSHSGEDVAVLLSHINAGIDIQNRDSKLERIASKFLAPNDLEVLNFPMTPIEDALCILWSIKESVFKTYGKGLPFKQIVLKAYSKENNTAKVEITNFSRKVEHLIAVHPTENGYVTFVIK